MAPIFHAFSDLVSDAHLGSVGEGAEEIHAGGASDANTTVGSRNAKNVTDMHSDAVTGETHEVRHIAVVEIGSVVAIFLCDVEDASGGVVFPRAGADREVHGYGSVDEALTALVYGSVSGKKVDENGEALTALVAKFNDHALLTVAVQQGVIPPRGKGGAIINAVTERCVIARYDVFSTRGNTVTCGLRDAHNSWRRRRTTVLRGVGRINGRPILHLLVTDARIQ